MSPTTTDNSITPTALTLQDKTGGAELTPEQLAGVFGAGLPEYAMVFFTPLYSEGSTGSSLSKVSGTISGCVK